MWSDKLISAVMQKGYSADWPKKMQEAFAGLYGSDGGRYPTSAKETVTPRTPECRRPAMTHLFRSPH